MIRDARPDDAGSIAALEARCAVHPWSEASVRSALDAPTGFGFIAERDGAPVGYLLATAVADEGELHGIGVAPDARRAGVARALLAACEARWTRAGVRRAWLEVANDNTPANALYTGAGWRVVRERPDYYGPGRPALILEWSR